LDGKIGETARPARVDVAPVGLELERNAGAREDLEEVPGVGDAERLATAERDVGNTGRRDGACEGERLLARELVAPRAVGPGLLAARDAARAAPVRQLPGDEERRPVRIDRAPF
jgi:hypothetical protein